MAVGIAFVGAMTAAAAVAAPESNLAGIVAVAAQ